MKKLFAILPCYNEGLNIEELIRHWNEQRPQLLEMGYKLEVIAIDDCSTDDTKQKILNMIGEHEAISLVEHQINKGLVGGLNTALSYFLEYGRKEDLLALMDGDNTHDPRYIHAMIKKLHTGKDCVIASRYCTDSGVVGLSAHREFMSDMAKRFYISTLKVPDVQDYTCGYRVYTYEIVARLLEEFGKDPIKEKSFACMMELLYRLHLVGASFGEVGFELRYDNKKGQSKMRVVSTAINSIRTAHRLKKLRNGNGADK